MPLRWRIGHGVELAMSLAADGDLRQPPARLAWCAAHGIPAPRTPARQVHGGVVLDDGSDAPCDGLVGSGALGIFGADCPSLVLAAPDAIAVAHCGWRGTAAGIVAAAVAALAARSAAPPAAWQAFVGPGVHPDDYEVDAAVLDACAWPEGCLRRGRPGRAWLDLPAAVAALAAAAGIGAVARTRLATSRHPLLRSHRRDGPGHPQLLCAWRTPCAT